MPQLHLSHASLSWTTATYDGPYASNQYAARFWNEFYDHVDADGFDALGAVDTFSDFKIFFDRTTLADPAPQVLGVYMKIGGTERLSFADGTTLNAHYGEHVDPLTRQLSPPD